MVRKVLEKRPTRLALMITLPVTDTSLRHRAPGSLSPGRSESSFPTQRRKNIGYNQTTIHIGTLSVLISVLPH